MSQPSQPPSPANSLPSSLFSWLGVAALYCGMTLLFFGLQLLGVVLFAPLMSLGTAQEAMAIFETAGWFGRAAVHGTVLMASIAFTGVVLTLWSLAIVRLKGGVGRQFFALNSFAPKYMWCGLGLLGVFLVGSELVMKWMNHTPPAFLELTLASAPVWLVVLTVVVIAPVYEEFVFRGLLWQALAARIGGGWGVLVAALVSSTLFALVHLQYDSFGMALIFVLALLLSYLRHVSGSLVLPIIIHICNNGMAMAQYFLQH